MEVVSFKSTHSWPCQGEHRGLLSPSANRNACFQEISYPQASVTHVRFSFPLLKNKYVNNITFQGMVYENS